MRTMVLVVILLCSGAFSPAVVAGQDAPAASEEGGPSKENPFLEAIPDSDAGESLARRVVRGDREAVAEFRNAGLTWAAHLWRVDRYSDELADACIRHWDWFEDMQRWEHTLLNSPPGEIFELFHKLKPRYRHAEAALARAILYASRYGDRKTMEAMVAEAPESAWVKAVLGYIGDGMETREAVKNMLLVVDDIEASQQLVMDLNLSLMVPKARRPDARTFERAMADYDNINKAAGICEFFVAPAEWRFTRYYERLGALAAETGDKEFIEELEETVKKSMDDRLEGNILWHSFYIAAHALTRDLSDIGGGLLDGCASSSAGPCLVAYGVTRADPALWHDRMLSAVAAWYGMPDVMLTRRFFLAQAMSSREPLLIRLCARSVLALRDDDLSSYQDIARALMRFGNDSELTAAWAKAMAASKNEDLARIASVVAKGDPEPLDSVENKPLGLNVRQKAALLAVFCHDDERGAHGGVQGVYWLNRAVFHEAARNLAEASEAHWQAMQAAEAARRARDINANILQYLLYAQRNMKPERLAAEIAAQPANRRALIAKVRGANGQLHAGKSGPLAALARLEEREALSDAMLKDLSGNPDKWGGTGLMLAAESGLLSRSFTQRRGNFEAAVRTSPLCFHVHMRAGPATDTLGTLTAANFKMAAAHSVAMAVVMPYSVDTLLNCGGVLARSGGAPIGLSALSVTAVDRAIALDWGGLTLSAMRALAYGRMYHQRLMHRRAASTGDTLTAERIHVYRHVSASMMHTTDPREMVRYGLNVRGPSPRWVDYSVQSYTRTHNFNNVNTALNFAITLCVHNPEGALRLVERADNSGVNRYGRFVGTQAWVGAKAKQGSLNEALARFREMRRDRTGVPPYLDNYLLAGLTNGNNHAEAETALAELAKHDEDDREDAYHFMLRRAHMMAGKHRQIAALKVPPNSGVLMEDAAEFTRLFHESRALLEIGAYEALAERSRPYTDLGVEAAMGTYLDAAVMKAISLKLTDNLKKQQGKMKVVEPAFVDAFLGDDGLLDWHMFEMLCGRRDFQPLPEAQSALFWHASMYGERPSVMLGSGVMTLPEVGARDAFLRGVCRWFLDDNEGARKHLAQCVEADQRNSHEYHVAEWLLANALKEKAD